MADSGRGARTRRAGRSIASASRGVGRASAATAGGAGRVVHRLSGASGARRTGLSNLIELTAAGGVGDAFVAVALAGTLFFSASVDQARGRIALALLITIAPFAVLAPFLGPMLDRVQQGRRYILMGTLLTRGLLCWGMAGAVQHNDAVTLLPAAFGVLVLQKAYGVTRAAVTPRLLPSEITLVTANARSALGALIASALGAGAAVGVSFIAGGGSGGAAWVLRVGTAIYLAATALALRLPSGVDSPPEQVPAPAGASPAGAGQAGAGQPGAGQAGSDEQGTEPPGPNGTRPMPGRRGGGRTGLRRLFKMPTIGPVVREAMQANAALRAYSGFMIFFLAFILRTVHFPGTSDKLALGEMIAAAGIGGFIGTGIGSALRSRSPQAIVFVMLTLATITTALCAVFFSLWAALVVALAAALGQALVKLALDSILQREIGEEVRSSTFAVSETLHQLSWVAGGLAGLLMSLTNSGVAGLTFAAVALGLALIAIVLARRRRVLRGRQAPTEVTSPVG
ncbi:MAG TPA: MFS transporter [Streptosporangiaceae bacterium]|nr:MFS transporter [Streptosporangiaceae bacterium]